MLRDERFLRENFKNIYTRLSTIVNKTKHNRQQKREIFSHDENVLSPTWERFIPNVGTIHSINGNVKKQKK